MPILNWVSFALGAFVSFLLCYLLHTLDIDYIQHKHAAELSSQATTLTEAFQKDKQITYGVSDVYETKLSALNNQLAAYRLHPAIACPVPTTGAAGRHDGAAGRRIPAGQNAALDKPFVEYAGEAEKYRLQLMACQSFITETWKAKGQ